MIRRFSLLFIAALLIHIARAASFTSAIHPRTSETSEGLTMNRAALPTQPPATDDWTYSTNAAILASPKLADLNNDNVDEILLTTYDVVNPYWGGWLYAWTGSGAIIPGFPIHLTGASPGTPAIGDLDHDGDMEIVQGTWNYLYVFNHDGSSYPGWPLSMYVTQAAALADLDGDLDLEIIVPVSNQMRIYHHDGAVFSGFPVSAIHDLTAASVGDLDGDGQLEIVAGSLVASGSPTDYVYAWQASGTPVSGFPVTAAGSVKSPPALADLDQDGSLEIIADCWSLTGSDFLYVWRHTGASFPGWPVNADYIRLSSPSIGDLDLNGDLEIVVGGWSTTPSGEKLYAYHQGGTAVSGFPVVLSNSPSGNINSTCTIGNIDQEPYPEIVIKAVNNIFALNHNGTVVPGFPIFLDDTGHTGTTSPTPAIGDPDGDGYAEIFAASTFNTVMLIDQPGQYFAMQNYWPTFRRDPANQGCFTPTVVPSDIMISMRPTTYPVQIPPGGSFGYAIVLSNPSDSTQSCDVWIMVRYPDGTWHGPVLGPVIVTVPGGGAISRLRRQTIAHTAPLGIYFYEGRVGDYPGAIWDSSGFAFTVIGPDGGGWLGSGDWSNTGESFKSANDEFIIHHSSFMIAARPNPFNASTAISFELRAASFVNLAIYDISGRRVATLVDGWREAGVHEVTFDGSSLPSGIYIARLEAGGQTQVQKMVLMR